jgi:hypothetical protein
VHVCVHVYVHVCVHVCVCVHAHAWVHEHMCVDACGSQRSALGVFLYHYPLFVCLFVCLFVFELVSHPAWSSLTRQGYQQANKPQGLSSFCHFLQAGITGHSATHGFHVVAGVKLRPSRLHSKHCTGKDIPHPTLKV